VEMARATQLEIITEKGDILGGGARLFVCFAKGFTFPDNCTLLKNLGMKSKRAQCLVVHLASYEFLRVDNKPEDLLFNSCNLRWINATQCW